MSQNQEGMDSEKAGLLLTREELIFLEKVQV
jgi:hypothetical protein